MLSPAPARCRLLCLLLAMTATVLLLGCGSTAYPADQSSARAQAIARVFGEPADISLIFYMDALRSDPVLGSMFSSASEGEDLLAYCPPIIRDFVGALTRASAIAIDVTVDPSKPGLDLENADIDMLLTLYEVPRDLDPGRAGQQGWALADTAPNGTRTYVPRPDVGGIRLFVFPNRTWAFGFGRTGAAAGASFARGAGPPPLQRPTTELGLVHMGSRALRQGTGGPDELYADLLPDAESASLIVRGGDGIRFDVVVRFGKEATAIEAERRAREAIVNELTKLARLPAAPSAAKAQQVLESISTILRFERDGAQLTSTFHVPAALIEKFSQP